VCRPCFVAAIFVPVRNTDDLRMRRDINILPRQHALAVSAGPLIPAYGSIYLSPDFRTWTSHTNPHSGSHFMADQTNPPPTRLRVLSLNCWGLKFISKFRNERLTEIGNQIAAVNPPPDIVGLQECWTKQDYDAIRERTIHFLPYGKFYYSGIFGGGLVILSKWPIEESNMYRYPLNGRPAAFYRGDWFVGKGVASARIRMGPNRRDVAEVFCTHVMTT
jgi:hypothetical protein